MLLIQNINYKNQDKTKDPSSRTLGRKAIPSAVPPKFAWSSTRTCGPCNGGRPAVSPRRLPGEPNRASAVWLAAGDQTSLGGVSRLFSRSSLISTTTYSIQKRKMQEQNPPSRRFCRDGDGFCRTRGYNAAIRYRITRPRPCRGPAPRSQHRRGCRPRRKATRRCPRRSGSGPAPRKQRWP